MLPTDRPELFACPRCRADQLTVARNEIICSACGETYPVSDGIPIMLASGPQRDATLAGRSDHPAEPAAFYNRPGAMENYFERGELPQDVTNWKKLLDFSPAGLTLEIGSGSGLYQDAFQNYVALDLSLLALRTYIKPHHLRVCGSAEALPFRSGSFEAVISRAAFEHVPRVDLAYAEALRVLKPGGMGYLFPSWNCAQWVCDALPIRPYRELNWRQKFLKATLPIHRHVLWKGLTRVPWRLWRAGRHRLFPGPTTLSYRSLRANYDNFWAGDADACSNLDVYETLLYFKSRGCRMIHPPATGLRPLLARAEPVVFIKPEG
jgi:uncharacterized protein YbaR (Trm112 family)/SAM-dependent methyltransferase